MNPRKRLFVLCTALPALVAFAAVTGELEFRPRAGATATKTCAIELELTVSDYAIEVNGEPIEKSAVEGLGEITALLNFSSTLTDTYVKTAGGRPLELARAYDTLELRGETGESSHTDREVAALAGETVQFVWDEEKHEYAKSLEDRTTKPDALAGLDVDMDALALLPAKSVATGDTWKVTGDAVSNLFVPGGTFGAGERGSEGAELRALLGQLATGVRGLELACTYAGTREEAGRSVAEVAFTFEGDVELDLIAIVSALADDFDRDLDGLESKAKLHLDGGGKLLWDPAAGHLVSLVFESELALAVDVRTVVEQQGQKLAVRAHIDASGKGSWELKAK